MSESRELGMKLGAGFWPWGLEDGATSDWEEVLGRCTCTAGRGLEWDEVGWEVPGTPLLSSYMMS